MNHSIEKYFIKEKNLPKNIYGMYYSNISRHEDIREEFDEWVQNRLYRKEGAVKVEGYTAEMIYQMAPFLDGVGVFNFLVTLKERPVVGLRIIKKGFLVK